MALNYYRWPLEEQTVLPPTEPRRVETISAIGDTNPGKYVPQPESIDAVNVALVLGMPLLVTGEPGCGKSELARSLAFQLGFMGPFKFVAKSNSQSRDLFYRYDALGRFYAIQANQGMRAANVFNFIEYTALGKAILLAHSRHNVKAFLPSTDGPRQPDWMTRPTDDIGHPWWQAEEKRSVVLIDEIDKAPRDFANDLLEELDKMQFQRGGAAPRCSVVVPRSSPATEGVLAQSAPSGASLANELVVRAANDAARAHESLLQTANRLYRRVSDTHSDELDVVATATRTADAGGQFSPVWAPRRVIPEYLILIETRGEHDHEALRLDALVSTLSASGLDIVRYYMKHDSNLCFQAPDKPAMRLDVLSARHPYHRLLVLGTGQVFINPAITQPWPWADEVLKWEHRAILTPAPLENWGRHESALAHLFAGPVGRATSEGFQELASLLDRVAMPDPTSFRVPYVARPFTWTSWYDNWVKRPDYWLGPDEIDSADWADLERMLQDYFTDEYGVFDRPAFDWLAACAVYPAIRWDLTVFLGVKLRWVDANGVELPVYTEARCARLASLPWFHAGYMPAWLRRRLIATIGPSQRVAVAHHLTDILERAVMGDEDATDAVRLKIYHDHPDIYAGEPLRDEVFLDFLAARDELWFQVPKKLSDIFHNLRSRQMFQECATLGLIALYSAATIVLVPWPSDGPLATGSWVPVGVLALSVVTWPLAKWLTKSWWPAP